MKSISRNTPGVLAASLLLAACATVPAPEYARQHPANPQATAAPAPKTTSALDNYRPANARKQSPDQSTTPEARNGPDSAGPESAEQPEESNHDHH